MAFAPLGMGRCIAVGAVENTVRVLGLSAARSDGFIAAISLVIARPPGCRDVICPNEKPRAPPRPASCMTFSVSLLRRRATASS